MLNNQNNTGYPNFFIIGAAKSGTTTLYSALEPHPQVYMPFAKEPKFFSDDELFRRGFDWYLHTYFRDGQRHPARGDASPNYLFWSAKVAPRIKAFPQIGSPKFIAIFRNPIQRAYSYYWQQVRAGREKLSFVKALEDEADRLREHQAEMSYSGLMQYAYFRGGQYASLLAPFLDLFSRESFHFLLLEDLRADFVTAIEGIFKFLQVDETFQTESRVQNPARLPRSMLIQKLLRQPSLLKEPVKRILPFELRYRLKQFLTDLNLKQINYPPLEKGVRRALAHRFEGDILALEKIIGRDLTHWRQVE